MPCAAPCNRLPCDERCSKVLDCGHRCPGLCGEPCYEDYCQDCGSRGDNRVDLLEFKSYKDIDLNETPIVVLGCGHFFTAESLDGLARLSEVYATSDLGMYNGLLDSSTVLAVPNCPDCKRPIRQYVTHRYNRVVNAAVMDQTSKKFLVKGQTDLLNLEQRIEIAEKSLEDSKADVLRRSQRPLTTPPLRTNVVQDQTRDGLVAQRYRRIKLLEREALKFFQAMGIENQPSKKLLDAIIEARGRQPLDSLFGECSLNESQKPAPERRVILGARLACLRIRDIILRDRFILLETTTEDDLSQSRRQPEQLAKSFFKDCQAFIGECLSNNLPRLSILGALAYAGVVTSLRASYQSRTEDTKVVSDHVATGRELLDAANRLCDSPFNGAKKLRRNVEAAQKVLGREWFEPVTAKELAAIKSAMVSGPGGIATHSGHWYKCSNGHVVRSTGPPTLHIQVC